MYNLEKKFTEVVRQAGTVEAGNADTKKDDSEQLLLNILSNKSILINEIPDAENGYHNFLISLNNMNLLKTGVVFDPNKTEYEDEKLLALQDLIQIKFLIAKIIWYLLTGLLTISVAYNSIIQSECKNSINYIEKTYAENQKEAENPENQTATNTRKYIQRGT
jgi:hypothetical protein